MIEPSKWDIRFLELAKFISRWSKDPTTKAGAVIADYNHRVVSIGYNGFPTRVKDRPELLNDRDAKLARTVHADVNAVLFARRELVACTMYTWPFAPCSNCAAIIIQSGLHRVVAPRHHPSVRWAQSIETAISMFREANVTIDLYDESYIGV